MITQELNDRLTRVGPGTPMGNLLRRYWFPVGGVSELEREPVQPVRLLGENLTLFRVVEGPGARGQGPEEGLGSGVWGLAAEPPTASPQPPTPTPEPPTVSPQPPTPNPQTPTPARFGLIAERCAHRGLSLAYGVPQENGLRCAYHGWTYDTEGRVVDMPFEPACLPLKVKSYPVEQLGGVIFAYLGPEPRPLVPRYDLFVRDDLRKSISMTPLPCNWVQCMDNSMDPVHFEHLHGVYGNYMMKKLGRPPAMNPARHVKIEFDVVEYGIMKRRLVEGDPEDADDWTIGHPVLFPNILAQGDRDRVGFQIRVPVDDTHTIQFTYTGWPNKPDSPPQESVPVNRNQLRYDESARVFADQIIQQDYMAWVGQGPISDRTQEHLATSDKGIMLYHNLLLENIEKVERGEDPIAVVRDRAKNYPMIRIAREEVGYQAFHIGVAAQAFGGSQGR